MAILTAASFTAILAVCALAVDLGSIYLQSRQLQGIADLAAMGAANDLNHAQAAAAATASANGWRGAVQAVTTTGLYTANTAIPVSQRFVAGGVSPNAARVTLTAPADLFFGVAIMGKQTISISRSATAASAQLASFSIGSRLLALQGGVANSLLSALTGSQVNLSVADYNALAGANVDLLQYSQALQTNLKLQGVSFDNVLSSQVNTGQALQVLANLLDTNGNDPAATAVNQIAAAAGNTTPAALNQLVDLGPYGDQDHAGTSTGTGIQVSALQFTTAMLELARGGHQVQLSLGAGVPGVAQTTAWLAIGQRPANSPWIAVNDDGSTVVRTAQIRLYVLAQIAPGLGALSGAGVGLVNVPVYVELASAQAKISSLSCPASTTDPAVTLAVQPSVGEIALGQVDTAGLSNFGAAETVQPAPLVNLPLIQATAKTVVNVGGQQWQSVSFSESDISAQTIKTVSTNDIVQGTVASLVANTNIQLQIAGLTVPIGLNALGPALQTTLTGVAPSLDGVVNALLALTGVKLGEADVWVGGLRCHNAALVA